MIPGHYTHVAPKSAFLAVAGAPTKSGVREDAPAAAAALARAEAAVAATAGLANVAGAAAGGTAGTAGIAGADGMRKDNGLTPL